MWRPTNHTAEAIEAFRAKRAEAGIGGVVCHALYLCNLAAPDRTIHEKSIARSAATVDSRARSRPTASSSTSARTSAPASGAALDRTCRGARADPRALRRRHVAADRELGRAPAARSAARSTSCDAARPARRASAARHLPRLVPPLRVGLRRHRPEQVDALVREVDEPIGLDRLRALHVNDSATPLGSNRDRHADVLEGEMGEGLGAFLAHPQLQHLSAYLETPGQDRQGVDRRGDPDAPRAPRPLGLTSVRRSVGRARSCGM